MNKSINKKSIEKELDLAELLVSLLSNNKEISLATETHKVILSRDTQCLLLELFKERYKQLKEQL